MTKFAVTAVEIDGFGEVSRGEVNQIVGGNRDLPTLSDESRILDRIQLVDLIDHGDQLYALVEREGERLPPHELRVRIDGRGDEYIESIQDGRVTDALARLLRLPPE